MRERNKEKRVGNKSEKLQEHIHSKRGGHMGAHTFKNIKDIYGKIISHPLHLAQPSDNECSEGTKARTPHK